MTETVVIARRFCGPPESANGGRRRLLDGPAEATLRAPPPLDRPLDVERVAGGVRILASGHLVAEAKPTVLAIDPPPPSFEEAVAASTRYRWWDTPSARGASEIRRVFWQAAMA